MCFFFFKQKTAYEIYQCDWSSDVCSSDLMKKCVGEKVGGDEEFLQNLDEAITLFAQHIDRLK